MQNSAVEVRNLSLHRGNEPVLHDVTLSAPSGQIIGLLGPSGSGKSTILRCINRLLEPPADTVFLEDEDVTIIDVIGLRRRVGMIFQQPTILPGSVEENLSFGPSLAGETLSAADVVSLLTLSDLDPGLARRPAAELSGGQAQRVALARTLANRPSVLLMDEPTSALDPASRRHIEEMVRRSCREEGVTAIWVTHDVEQAQSLADYLYLLVDGRILDQGKPEHVLATHGDHVHLLQRFAAGELEARE